MSELSLIKMYVLKTMFFDCKLQKTYFINKLISDYDVKHVRVIYLVSTDGTHKQQFTDFYFFSLLQIGQIKQL
jgi:hypothetical protein